MLIMASILHLGRSGIPKKVGMKKFSSNLLPPFLP